MPTTSERGAPSIPGSSRFQFVVTTQPSDQESTLNRHRARSHTARVNRVRFLNQQKQIQASNLSESRPTSEDPSVRHLIDAGPSVEQRLDQCISLPLRRTPAPVYGALTPETFQPGRSPAASHVLRYCMILTFSGASRSLLTSPQTWITSIPDSLLQTVVHHQ